MVQILQMSFQKTSYFAIDWSQHTTQTLTNKTFTSTKLIAFTLTSGTNMNVGQVVLYEGATVQARNNTGQKNYTDATITILNSTLITTATHVYTVHIARAIALG